MNNRNISPGEKALRVALPKAKSISLLVRAVTVFAAFAAPLANAVDAGRLRRAIDLSHAVARLLGRDLADDDVEALAALLYRSTR